MENINLESIETNGISISELWIILEMMDSGNYKVISSSSFAELNEFTIELDNKERFEINEFFEQITKVYRI